ncbi:MAG: hypothetical protein V2J02_15675 [Pseudomonadales bacterium]|jgi:hypothetical protein|nr:hypothetical protein [Pseudomonadales bacterium]
MEEFIKTLNERLQAALAQKALLDEQIVGLRSAIQGAQGAAQTAKAAEKEQKPEDE